MLKVLLPSTSKIQLDYSLLSVSLQKCLDNYIMKHDIQFSCVFMLSETKVLATVLIPGLASDLLDSEVLRERATS